MPPFSNRCLHHLIPESAMVNLRYERIISKREEKKIRTRDEDLGFKMDRLDWVNMDEVD